MSYILDCKNIETAIRRAKKKLIAEVEKNGLYENFGQREVRLIREKFIDISSYTEEMKKRREALNRFDNWAMSYNREER